MPGSGVEPPAGAQGDAAVDAAGHTAGDGRAGGRPPPPGPGACSTDA
jgi:hypothetical protein